VGLDISPEFLRCSIVRSKKYNFNFDAIVGDAENLPIISKSFDYGLVDGGLHHLPNPYLGIQELSRISRKGIIIIDSFKSKLTNFLVKFDISSNTECGVPINRFNKIILLKSLKELGFNDIKLKCFYIYMRTKTPKIYKIFDDYNGLWRIIEVVFKLLNITGKIGNRFVLVAERSN
jgi:ubiquinone/menaquinone biosynthesis C-methylase UbiE